MLRLVSLAVLVLALGGCDALFPGTGSEPPPPSRLEILGVEVSPEVVRPDDVQRVFDMAEGGGVRVP